MTQDLTRPPETKHLSPALQGVDAEGIFVGYASVFGRQDMAHDVVERGAFAASLARRGTGGIRMLWHHDPAQPIGRWLDIREDEHGLAVRGQLLTELTRGAEARVLMRAGAIDGLSIGFRTVRSRADRKGGVRRLVEVDLWEISVVCFPMLPDARVVGVKGAGLTLPPVRTLTERLRRAAEALRT